MITTKVESRSSAPSLAALETALEQGHDVKAKVEECAEDLGAANAALKDKISDGKIALPAEQTLREGEAIEVKVKECAEDLQDVTDNLAEGLGALREVENALGVSRDALAESETALMSSRRAEQAASWKAMHDVRTGLPNRALFDDRLEQALAGAHRHEHSLAVMFFDLNRFKSINDTYGHGAGDAVLMAVAERLLRHARREDTVCRNGGDEFLYLLIDPKSRINVERIARFLLDAIALPIEVGRLSITITPSIGVAIYPDHGRTAEILVEHADRAMYLAKERSSGLEVFEAVASPGVKGRA